MNSKKRIIFKLCVRLGVLFIAGKGIFSFMSPNREPTIEEIMESYPITANSLPRYTMEPYTDMESYTDTSSNTSGEEPKESVLSFDQRLHNAYVNINNDMLGSIHGELSLYFSQVSNEETFTLLNGEDDFYYLDVEEHDLNNVEMVYLMLRHKKEKDSLDQAFLEMYPSLREIASTLEYISEYTFENAYYEDDFELAQVYHTALLEFYEEYMTASEAFIYELGAASSQWQDEAMARMQETGHDILYSLNMVIDLSSEMRKEIYNQCAGSQNLLNLDIKTIQPMYDEFIKYADIISEYSTDDESLQSQGIDSYDLDYFIDYMSKTESSLTELIRHVKDKNPLVSDWGIVMTADMYDESLENRVSSLIYRYNSIVQPLQYDNSYDYKIIIY